MAKSLKELVRDGRDANKVMGLFDDLMKKMEALGGERMEVAIEQVKRLRQETEELVESMKDIPAEGDMFMPGGLFTSGDAFMPDMDPMTEIMKEYAAALGDAVQPARQIAEYIDKMTEGTVRLIDLWGNTHEMMSSTLHDIKQFSAGLSGALIDTAMGAKRAFADFFKQLLSDLAKAIMRAIIFQTILGIFKAIPGLGSLVDTIGKFLGPSGFQERESSVIARNQGAAGLSRLQPATAGAGGGGFTANVTPTIIVHEPGPLTRVEYTDKYVIPRLRERRRTMNEEPF